MVLFSRLLEEAVPGQGKRSLAPDRTQKLSFFSWGSVFGRFDAWPLDGSVP